MLALQIIEGCKKAHFERNKDLMVQSVLRGDFSVYGFVQNFGCRIEITLKFTFMGSENKAFPTPYPEQNSVLRILVCDVQKNLDDNFVGAYLQGSFTVGNFGIHSDVDFIVVI